MKGTVFVTEWRVILLEGLAQDKFTNEKAIVVVAANVIVLYNIDCLAVEDQDDR